MRPARLRSLAGSTIKITEAQKVSKSALMYISVFHAHTTASAPESMNDSTKMTRPCFPNTPERSPEKEYAMV